MKRTKQFDKIFNNMKVEAPKVWRITTFRVVHRDRKKETNKYACRKVVI